MASTRFSKRSSAHIQDSVSTTPAKVMKGFSSATGARVPAGHSKEKDWAANGELLSVLSRSTQAMCTGKLSLIQSAVL